MTGLPIGIGEDELPALIAAYNVDNGIDGSGGSNSRLAIQVRNTSEADLNQVTPFLFDFQGTQPVDFNDGWGSNTAGTFTVPPTAPVGVGVFASGNISYTSAGQRVKIAGQFYVNGQPYGAVYRAGSYIRGIDTTINAGLSITRQWLDAEAGDTIDFRVFRDSSITNNAPAISGECFLLLEVSGGEPAAPPVAAGFVPAYFFRTGTATTNGEDVIDNPVDFQSTTEDINVGGQVTATSIDYTLTEGTWDLEAILRGGTYQNGGDSFLNFRWHVVGGAAFGNQSIQYSNAASNAFTHQPCTAGSITVGAGNTVDVELVLEGNNAGTWTFSEQRSYIKIQRVA